VPMGDQLEFAAGHPLALLPRAWWFPGLPGYRPDSQRATYVRHALDEQPGVPHREDLNWLEDEAEKAEWSITNEDSAPVRVLTAQGIEVVAAGLPVPPSLQLLAERPELQRRIRSATACFLDLGDFAAATTIEGGCLVHVLSDQQWVRHWMLYLDGAGSEAVLTSAEPIGFDLPADWPPPPRVIPIGTGEIELEVCADSFAEFLYRFWIENEIYFATRQNQALSPAAAAYAARLLHPTGQ
jgi:hypothetical protein